MCDQPPLSKQSSGHAVVAWRSRDWVVPEFSLGQHGEWNWGHEMVHMRGAEQVAWERVDRFGSRECAKLRVSF